MVKPISLFVLTTNLLLSCFAFASSAKPTEYYLNFDDGQAQFQMAQNYQLGTNIAADPYKAAYWYMKAALNGYVPAQYQLGLLYEKDQVPLSSLDIAEMWLQTAIDIRKQAANFHPDHVTSDQTLLEETLSRILEEKFNAQRARQISSITPDNEQNNVSSAVTTIMPVENSIPLLSTLTKTKNNEHSAGWASFTLEHLSYILASILGVVIVIAATVLIKNWRMSINSEQIEKQQNELLNEQKKNKQLMKQLNAMYKEVQKQQQAIGEQKVVEAYALFGLIPYQSVELPKLKTRYKLLSKVYHPDGYGSDEEMQRLNNAVKLISQHAKLVA